MKTINRKKCTNKKKTVIPWLLPIQFIYNLHFFMVYQNSLFIQSLNLVNVNK